MHTKLILFGVFIICVVCCTANTKLHFSKNSLASFEEKGKKHLQSLKEKTILPQYGACWMEALDFLQDGCRLLSDSVHIDIALRFTNCFMIMSGQGTTLECHSERTEALKRLCMSEMSDRNFAVYTEFFTQAQSMCYFLQNLAWHHETEKMINRLFTFSQAATEQLETVYGLQNVLLQKLHEQYNIQAELLILGRNLSLTLEGSKSSLETLTYDLKQSTVQHSLVLEELFHEFHQLHRWIVGRYAFVDGLIFYFSYLTFLLILTSIKRTASARGLLLVVFLLCMCVELFLYKHKIVSDTISLDYYRWFMRQLSLACSLIALFYQAYRFKHFPIHALEEIREQNQHILEYFKRLNLHPVNILNTDYRHGSSSTYVFGNPKRPEGHAKNNVIKLKNVKESDKKMNKIFLRSASQTTRLTSVKQREPSLA